MVTDRALCGSESETLRKPSAAAVVLGGRSGEATRLLKMPKHRCRQQELVGAFGKRQYFETLFLVFGIRLSMDVPCVASPGVEFNELLRLTLLSSTGVGAFYFEGVR